MLADLPRAATFANNLSNTIILAVPEGNVTRIFSAVSSPDEAKFRRKVGEYHAMTRFYDNVAAGMILPGFWVAQDVLDGLNTQT